MHDPIVFDDGVRLTDGIRVRVPAEFRERLKAAAEAEGISLTKFARRAIAERIGRSSLNTNGPGPAPTEVLPPPAAAVPSTSPAVAEAVPAPVAAIRAPPQSPAADQPAPPSWGCETFAGLLGGHGIRRQVLLPFDQPSSSKREGPSRSTLAWVARPQSRQPHIEAGIHDPEKVAGQHDDLGSLIRVAECHVPMRLRVLVVADRAREELHSRDPLATIRRHISQRSGFRCEGHAHQLHTKQ